MQHTLRIDLLNRPNVGHIVRAEELVGGSLFPPKKTPFVASKEAFSRQHRMQFVPDDLLGEIKPRGLEGMWVVPDVRVPAPDKKETSGEKNPSQVSKPGQ